jgi:hypothetical protein
LIHHVKNADQFSLLGDVLTQRFKAIATANPKNDEHLRRMLEVVAVPCAVRQGSRLTGMFSTFRFRFLKKKKAEYQMKTPKRPLYSLTWPRCG